MQKKKDPNQRAAEQAEKFFGQHDNPSPEQLKKMMENPDFLSLERLRELADLYNVTYDESTTAQELHDRISLRQDQEGENPFQD